ncbi:helix-turn-helix transcriptional regulator [Streptomyces globosus]
MSHMQTHTIGQAARLPGAGPDTARRRADAGRGASHRDASGRRVIDGRDPAAFAVEAGRGSATDDRTPHTSARSAFRGTATAVRPGDVAARIGIKAGPHRIVPLPAREAVAELGPAPGMRATPA